MRDTIYLDPDLFMALGLSAEAHGGIGHSSLWRCEYGVGCFTPNCIHGHADGLGLGLRETLDDLGLTTDRNDGALIDADFDWPDRTSFENWCRIVGVDVAE